MEILAAIQVLNALMTMGINGLATAQKVGAVIELAQKEKRDITPEEWDLAIRDADEAELRLASAIAAARS